MISGHRRLSGMINVQGSKNSVLPVMAAALLTEDKVIIENCPAITDVYHMQKVMQTAGAECDIENDIVTVRSGMLKAAPDEDYCARFRASSLFMGVFLAVCGSFVMPYPGGCNIGSRPLNYHIDGLRSLGAVVEEAGGYIIGYCSKLKGGNYEFPYPSVGALENIILAAVRAEGKTCLTNCAKEPEIVDLCDCLKMMGADIEGAGTGTIIINGKETLHGCRYRVPGDRIAAGTYMAGCAIAGGNICLHGIEPERLTAVSDILQKMGCHLFTDKKSNEIIVMADGRRRAVTSVVTGPYPEFPTDMQAQIMSVLAYSGGCCDIYDNVFENRYNAAGELVRMGAVISVSGGHARICGRPALKGARVCATDLRCGAALVIAALGADCTIVDGCSYICRGYEDIQRDLEQLGADIKWIPGEEHTEDLRLQS